MKHCQLRELSLRAQRTPASPIRRLSGLAHSAKDEGVQVLHLNIGQPDLPSPKEFTQAIKEYDAEIVAYEASEGNPELIRNWSKYVNQELDLETSPEEYLITMGASEALVFFFMVCCDPGDEVLIFDPTYANYIGFAAIAGVHLVPILSRLEESFRLPSMDEIARSITPSTRAVLLCSPNNPTGTTYSKEELEQLYQLCEERDLFLAVDETYREIVFDGKKPLSILHVAPKSKRVAVIDSLSKRFSLCGARIGCLYSPNRELISKCLNMAQARLAGPSVEQFAAAKMLSQVTPDYVIEIRKEYERRRDVLCERLSSIPEVVLQKPSGAFYTIARLPVDDTEAFSSFLLRQYRDDGKTAFLAPAAGFYMGAGRGHHEVRVAFVLEEKSLLKAGDIIEGGLKAYRRD